MQQSDDRRAMENAAASAGSTYQAFGFLRTYARVGLLWLPRHQTALLFGAAWLLILVVLPLTQRSLGAEALPRGVTISVLLQLSAVIAILVDAWGWGRVLRVAVVVAALAWAAEALGAATGFPFGAYRYTAALQPQLAQVQLLVPLAWLMLLPPAWAAAQAIVGSARPLRFALASALAFTAWDLLLDPHMVSWGFWVWAAPSGYFGIPWTNFLGWLLVSGAITRLVRPAGVPVRPLLLVYTITWALEAMGLAFFWHLPGPAAVGGLAVGLFALLAWRGVARSPMP
ncbi:carotenoid biosynthesis protein [Candidatus Amarolinea aalborgensis]|uniref:carotenoid biosynthesis protein n=1 Tax=Candidatus Amarolinea aalborgensis TaxID=2249329 RepID=UPI003BF952CA